MPANAAATMSSGVATKIHLGLRGRLLLAFFGISSLAILGASSALYSFREIDAVLGEFPDPLIARKISPGFAKFFNCSVKTEL